MTSFARIEEERVFLDRCERLYRRVQNIKARVDNSTPTCMYGSFLGKRNERRKTLTSAGSARTQSSGGSEIEIPEEATIEQKIEHFFIQINYKNPPRVEGKRFPYLKQPPRIDPVPPQATDLMDVHSIAFTQSYPRILRYHTVGSKLRQMPLLYQKVSVSSSEELKSDESTSILSSDSTSESSESQSSGSSASASDDQRDETSTRKNDSETDSQKSITDGGGVSSSSESSSSKSIRSKSRRASSSVSTLSSQKNAPAVSISTKSSSKPSPPKTQGSERRPVLEKSVSMMQNSSADTPDESEGVDHRPQSPVEVSNADTTHGIPPMESTANSPLHEDSDTYMNFLNDVTDVILGMNMFSPSAIEAAIDAILATNLYGDLDKERARLLVDQLFT